MYSVIESISLDIDTPEASGMEFEVLAATAPIITTSGM
jgi:hypothetical protein